MSSRRQFLTSSAAAITSLACGETLTFAQDRGERPARPDGITVLNPRDRIPLSFIIDDSTCLVNLAHSASRSLPRSSRRTTSRTGRSCHAKSRMHLFASLANGVATTV